MRPQFGTTYLLYHRPIRLKQFRNELSTLFIPALTACLMPILCSSLDTLPCGAQSKTVSQVLQLRGRTQILPTSPAPSPRDPALLSRLRAPSKFPRIPNRTKKYQSFISHALSKYQTSQILVAHVQYIFLCHVSCLIVFCVFIVFLLLPFSFYRYYWINICSCNTSIN